MDQRSDEWIQARVGSLGASKIGDALSRLKKSNERTQKAQDFMDELAAERLTGLPARRVNALQWGVDHEPEARAAYAFRTNAAVTEVGLIPHPTIARAHCSPDALVGDDGGLEVKCPTSAVHFRTIIDGVVPEEHLAQIVWCMACSGRQWWDFLSYDPRFPPGLQMFERRVVRDDGVVAAMEKDAIAFLAEIDQLMALIKPEAA